MGATFAYFTASNTINTTLQGATDTQLTKKLVGATFKSEVIKFGTGQNEKLGALDYPGGSMLIGTVYSISKNSDPTQSDKNDYESTFDINLEAINTTGETLNWYLLGTKNVISKETFSGTTCELQKVPVDDSNGGSTKNYYTGCSPENIISGNFSDIDLIGYGTINSSVGDDSEPKADIVISNPAELELGSVYPSTGKKTPTGITGLSISTKSGEDKYYFYLIVEFPNKETPQDSAQGKKIQVQFATPKNISTNIAE